MKTLRRAVATACVAMACSPAAGPPPRFTPAASHDPTSFLVARLRPFPDDAPRGEIAVTDPASGRVAVYDSALVALVLLRAGQRERAARVLLGLAALQSDDGALPFSFTLPVPDEGARYERSGAIAWVGYAAAEYLDADAGGPARDDVLRLAHRAAAYLLALQVTASGDRREGLVRGGRGTLRYVEDGDAVREVLEPGDVTWASVEHNIDAFFFLRALARVTDTRAYADAATRIAHALVARAWSPRLGQFVEGLDASGPDDAPALDCASWGALFLAAIGDSERAATASTTADTRYTARDPSSGVAGHRPYAAGPVFPEEVLARHLRRDRKAHAARADERWEHLDVVWPEGSAGVALAALRVGAPSRARAVVDGLESLRDATGALPTATTDVPFLFDRTPSIAGTAWVELVRFDLDRPRGRQTLWPSD
jgi:hypothetical protein